MKNIPVVRIILPSVTLFNSGADMVNLPGEEGVLGVLPDHCNMIANLDHGIVSIFVGQQEHKYFIYAGIARITPEGLNILCEFAVNLAQETRIKTEEYIAALKLKISGQDNELQRDILSEKIKKYQTLLRFL